MRVFIIHTFTVLLSRIRRSTMHGLYTRLDDIKFLPVLSSISPKFAPSEMYLKRSHTIIAKTIYNFILYRYAIFRTRSNKIIRNVPHLYTYIYMFFFRTFTIIGFYSYWIRRKYVMTISRDVIRLY